MAMNVTGCELSNPPPPHAPCTNSMPLASSLFLPSLYPLFCPCALSLLLDTEKSLLSSLSELSLSHQKG